MYECTRFREKSAWKGVESMKHKSAQKDSFLEREIVASATECTGLMPSLSDADPDAELNEARLYAIHAPKKRDGEWVEGCEREKGEENARS